MVARRKSTFWFNILFSDIHPFKDSDSALYLFFIYITWKV